MPQRKNNPSKGRSSGVRRRNATPPPQAVILQPESAPLLPVPCEVPSVEVEERTAKISLDLKFPGVGRLLVDVVRVFRCRHLR